MDNSGNIKQFTEEEMKQQKHILEGYVHELSSEQAKEFLNYPQGERLMWLAWNKYFDKLDSKVDTIKKLEMRKQFFEGYKAAKGES